MGNFVDLVRSQVAQDIRALPSRKFDPVARRLAGCHSLADIREAAKAALPRPVFDFVDGAADDEVTSVRNRSDFENIRLAPGVLRGIAPVDTSTTLFGTRLAAPIVAAPTGLLGLVHAEGEMGVARGFQSRGSVSILSASSSYSMEEVAEAAPGPKWFQLYIWRDRKFVGELIDRARKAGYSTLFVTVDVPCAGNRGRDIRNGFTIPPRLTASTLWQGMTHPRWAVGFLRSQRVSFGNVMKEEAVPPGMTPTEYVNSLFDPGIGWADIEWIRDRWNGPMVLKGILRPEDARRARDIGAHGVLVSNHGGRQLDGSTSSIAALPAIVDAVGTDIEILIDSGVRRGTDVLKALALGARACVIGRPPVFGLGAGGERGVERVFDLLSKELRTAMTIAGYGSVADIDRECIAC